MHEFDVPENPGKARRIPRFWGRIKHHHKAKLLRTVYSMIMSGALPQPGDKDIYTHAISQEQLAANCGLGSRSTFTHGLSLFSNAHDRPATETVLIERRRNYSEPNSYSYSPALPRAVCFFGCSSQDHCTHESHPTQYYAPALRQLRSSPEVRAFWPESDEKEAPTTGNGHRYDRKPHTGVADYKEVPRWVWDSRVPLSDTARLVLTYYILAGLLDPRDREQAKLKKEKQFYKVKGRIDVSQKKAAARCGISVKALYHANLELSGKVRRWAVFAAKGRQVGWWTSASKALVAAQKLNARDGRGKYGVRQLPGVNVIRVAHPKAKKDPTMPRGWKRGVQIILYVPSLEITREEAIIETERMLAARKAIQDHGWRDVATKLHGEVLRAYTGHEHTLQAFYNELRRRYLAAGMAQQHIRALIPSPPD